MTNKASSIDSMHELALARKPDSWRAAALRRLDISSDRGVAHANALFALSMIVWGVLDSILGDGPVVLPIGAVLAFVFYRFAVVLSKGDAPSPRWLSVSGRTSAFFAVFSVWALWGSLTIKPLDIACAIWSVAFIGGFGLYAYHTLWTHRESE